MPSLSPHPLISLFSPHSPHPLIHWIFMPGSQSTLIVHKQSSLNISTIFLLSLLHIMRLYFFWLLGWQCTVKMERIEGFLNQSDMKPCFSYLSSYNIDIWNRNAIVFESILSHVLIPPQIVFIFINLFWHCTLSSPLKFYRKPWDTLLPGAERKSIYFELQSVASS